MAQDDSSFGLFRRVNRRKKGKSRRERKEKRKGEKKKEEKGNNVRSAYPPTIGDAASYLPIICGEKADAPPVIIDAGTLFLAPLCLFQPPPGALEKPPAA